MAVRLLGIIDRRYEIVPVVTACQQSAVSSQKSQSVSTFHYQHSKHLPTVGVAAYLLVSSDMLLHLCCRLTT
jgi:hypothetical protein